MLVKIAHYLRAPASNISIAVEGYQAKVIELNDQLPEKAAPSPEQLAAVISQLIKTNQQIQKWLQQVKTQEQNRRHRSNRPIGSHWSNRSHAVLSMMFSTSTLPSDSGTAHRRPDHWHI